MTVRFQNIAKYQIIILLLLLTGKIWGNDSGNGLSFYSHETNKDKRTELNLTPEKPFRFSKGFSLCFDFCFRQGITGYGYIFRGIGDENINFDLLSSIPTLDELDLLDREFLLVIKNQILIKFSNNKAMRIMPGEWVHVELTFDQKKGQITLNINGLEQTTSYNFGNTNDYQFFFGSNSHKDFATSDVPPITLKDIHIHDHNKKPVYHWKLSKHAMNAVYDEHQQAMATVENPIWEINTQTEWKSLQSFRFQTTPHANPKIAWDEQGKRFFFVESDCINIYNVESDVVETIYSESGVPCRTEIHQLSYDSKKNELISFAFNEDSVNRFNLQTKQWSKHTESNYLPYFIQSSSHYDEISGNIYTMGGYGFYKYSSLLQIYKENDKQWIKHNLSEEIHPRYLASMGAYKDSLLLYFGGYGNESGKQQESPHNYYDLYSINKNNLNVTKIWELQKPDIDFTNSSSLIVNEDDNLFYALSYSNKVYETYALLHEYSLNEPSYRVIGDSIPFNFNDIESFCNLYMPADKSRLYALVSYTKDNIKEVSVYSIAYPPLSHADTLQDIKKEKSGLHIILIITSALLTLIIICYTYFKRKKKKTITSGPESEPKLKYESELTGSQTNENLPEARFKPEAESESDSSDDTTETPGIYPSINLLGEFALFNSENINIARPFTPTAKHLFLLLLLYSINRKKISSPEIQNILWPFKDHDNARNSRNVYFNKLRLLLNNMEEIKIINEKDQWFVSCSETVYIDYEDIRKSIRKMGKYESIDKTEFHALVKKIKKGKFLPFYEFEWLDEYKSEYSDMVIDFLYSMAERPEFKNEYTLLSEIADAILVQDSIDEKGVKIKCFALMKLGKQKQAMLVFNKYKEYYNKLLGEKPDILPDNFFLSDHP